MGQGWGQLRGGVLWGPSQAGPSSSMQAASAEAWAAPPQPTPPPPPQPSAVLAIAEPGWMASVLAPSEQDQSRGRKCGQSPACILRPHPTTTLVPLGPGRAGTLGLAAGGLAGWALLGPHGLSRAASAPMCGLNSVKPERAGVELFQSAPAPMHSGETKVPSRDRPHSEPETAV